MANSSEVKNLLNYTVEKEKFLKEIHHLIDELYAAYVDYIQDGLTITFSNGQKFVLSLEEYK